MPAGRDRQPPTPAGAGRSPAWPRQSGYALPTAPCRRFSSRSPRVLTLIAAQHAALLPYAGNARTHSTEQVAQIAASILEFGFVAPTGSLDEVLAAAS